MAAAAAKAVAARGVIAGVMAVGEREGKAMAVVVTVRGVTGPAAGECLARWFGAADP